MKRYYSVFLLLFFSLMAFNAQSQDCWNYHELKCKYNSDPDYKYSGQSRSGAFSPGRTSSFEVQVDSSYNYSFTICYAKKLGDVEFKITNKETNEVLFNNSEEDYTKTTVLPFDYTGVLLFEVAVPENEKLIDKMKKKGTVYCVGVLIEYVKADKLGFGF